MRIPDQTSLPATLQAGHPLFGLGYNHPTRPQPFLRLAEDATEKGEAPVAEEVPVALVYNGQAHAVMMTTPADFEDFAVGFTITEEIVSGVRDIERIGVIRFSQGVELQIDIPEEAAGRLARRGRQLVGRTGCGLCGVQTINEALREARPVSWREPIKAEALWRAEAALFDRQEYNQATGSMHAAAWARPNGTLHVVREDVGRHNALDKVIGALGRSDVDPGDGFVVMTSRASYELVQKAAVVGIPLLAAVSRPTGLAIRLAEATGLTLIGLLRGRSGNVYSHPEQIDLAAQRTGDA